MTMSKRKAPTSDGLVFSLETPNTLGTALHEEAVRKRQRKSEAKAVLDDPKNHEPIQPEQVIPNPSPGTVCLVRRASGQDLIPLAQRKNRGGRPRTKKVEVNKNHKLKLRKNSPIKAEIPLDIWHQVFMQCPPRFLLKARTVHRSWLEALQYESTWIQARKNHYGTELPPPPPGLTELQYADLLCGVGCQSKGCTDQKARKTYWGFLRRWCDNCLKKDLVLDKRATEYQMECARFRDCVPPIRVDSWGHYQWVGSHNPRTNYTPGVVRCAYSKMAVEKFLLQYRTFLEEGSKAGPVSDEEKCAWLDTKQLEAQALTKSLEEIEAWEEAERISKSQHSADKRDQRDKFFKIKALELDISGEDMDQLDSFRRAIKISKAPHDRCWEILKPKVSQEYTELLQVRKEKKEKEAQIAVMKQQYAVLEARRISHDTPEQTFVLSIFDDSLRTLRSDKASVAYADLIPLLLRMTWDSYNHLPDEEKPKDSNGDPYALLMDDFRGIWKLKICPLIRTFDDQEGINAALALKCPMTQCGWHYNLTGRTTGPIINFTFQDIVQTRIDDCPDEMIQHVLSYHSEQLWQSQSETDALYLARCNDQGMEMLNFLFERDFPWHLAKWPRNLPLLSLHQTVAGWSADKEFEYQRRTPDGGIHSDCLGKGHHKRTMSLGHVINRFDSSSPRSPLLPPIRTGSPLGPHNESQSSRRTLHPLDFGSMMARSASISSTSTDVNIDPSLQSISGEPGGLSGRPRAT